MRLHSQEPALAVLAMTGSTQGTGERPTAVLAGLAYSWRRSWIRRSERESLVSPDHVSSAIAKRQAPQAQVVRPGLRTASGCLRRQDNTFSSSS